MDPRQVAILGRRQQLLEDDRLYRWGLEMVYRAEPHRDRKQRADPYTVEDFVPHLEHIFNRDGRRLSPEEGAVRLAAMRRAADADGEG